MNVRINSGETKNPVNVGICGRGYNEMGLILKNNLFSKTNCYDFK